MNFVLVNDGQRRRADVVAILAAQDGIDVKERCRVSTAGGRGDRHVELHGLLELHLKHVDGIAITELGVSVGPRGDDVGRR